MSTVPNDISNIDGSTTDGTVTATVTRTVTTAGANGQEIVVFSSTDVKSIGLSSDDRAEAIDGKNDSVDEGLAPVFIDHEHHSEGASTYYARYAICSSLVIVKQCLMS